MTIQRSGPETYKSIIPKIENFVLTGPEEFESCYNCDVYQFNVTKGLNDIYQHRNPINPESGSFRVSLKYSLNFEVVSYLETSTIIEERLPYYPFSWIYLKNNLFTLEELDESYTLFENITQLMIDYNEIFNTNTFLLFNQHWHSTMNPDFLSTFFEFSRIFLTTLDGTILSIIIYEYIRGGGI
jgi:hypothetical protein